MSALRIARSAGLQASRAAPRAIAPYACSRTTIFLLTTSVAVRYNSTRVEPSKKAASIIDALPGNSILSKTGILTAGAALSAIAISKEIYVVNEETTVLAAFIGILAVIVKAGGGPYNEWAEGHIGRMRDLLNSARADHTAAVQQRIDSVSEMKDVVGITKSLFAISKETAELEAKAFELQQRVAFATEAKTVLDSWVRYEAGVRQREQKELAESVIAKIQKEITNPKVQQQILQQSIADVERLIAKA
ncbi:hypothetical protein BCR37DRAFT_413750 [Protomyces lactucae-debilis]|uniref:ATP synthase subunit 4 n=1 Tax=Protomyces lactucae-debilis TaxID=2754530 RepID=A0A1Y2FDR1_PROLT|nr:uncharacterized protein BCR37DRAFT_413750 [Protomyces lactucae-debilis]ORY82061.1 hypothetical protein BCR37DRAFT_413750 [Protomyces lactucae-debilis]